MNKKHIISLLMIAMVLLLAACSNNEEADSGSDEGGDGVVKISVFSQQNSTMDLETNWYSNLIEDKFNIDFNWQTTTWDNTAAAEARSIAMASGDYPDMFLLIPWVDQFSQAELINYGKQGALIPLNDLIKEHAPNIQEVLDNHEYYAAMATAPDGNIYGLPQLNECFHCTWNNKLWLNQTWLDNLGLDTPTTHEELEKVLEAFKNEDPNGNGKNDEIPLSGVAGLDDGGIITYLMNGFIYDDATTRLIVEDGKVDFAPIKEGWKEGLAYMNGLYEKGLIDSGAFSQNQDALYQLGGADEMILGGTAIVHPAMIATDLEIHNQYSPVAPLQGPNGAWGRYDYPSKPGGTFALTNKASEEAQIAAIKVIDYMFTEEGKIPAENGEEGVGWQKPEEGDVAINEDVEPILKQIPLAEGEEERNDSWGPLSQYYHPTEFRDGLVQDMDIYSAGGYERRLQEATYLYEGTQPEEVFPHWAVWYDLEVIDELSMMRTNIEDYIYQNAVQFITGDKSLESDWDEYVEGFNRLGLDRYLEIMQQAFDNAQF
ncbi:putative aldouronate transport system substrate-binding protein [Gracilibacillus halotolerans]|uniref:Putative aldouronate transport system substrate-binding protein n=1 Tax=Gracilibacillus halotolerans TaxID=74386 RepID=A0A841RLZ7_9BACI|nr:putative aldouronate transport system substrate-binding protein [Gracilibacillus halotolerans]